jgi:ribosomal protein L11 methyltransferase
VFAVEPEAREALSVALWEAGTLGIEDGAAEMAAWFAVGAPAVEAPAGASLLREEPVPATDWLAPYRELAQPLAVGERFWLDPREPDAPALEVPPGRIPLKVPARTAFGTGSHASTRLALRLLEGLPVQGARLLDVGAGSGVLSLAARALGARAAVGLDVDVAAALLAGQHARLNALAAGFWAGSLAALGPGATFDVVVVNALPHEVLPEAPAIAAAVSPVGWLVVSGVPAVDESATAAAWAALGLAPVQHLAEEEWVAWALTRPV